MKTASITFKTLSHFIICNFRAWRRDRPYLHSASLLVLLRQIQFTGMAAFQLTALAAILVAGLLVSQMGSTRVLGEILVATLLREMGPLITLLIVIARSASAVASELSAMRSNGELESLRTSGVSPLSYLVFPRVLAGGLSTLFLAMHFVWIALFVSFLIAQIPASEFIAGLLNALSPWDLLVFFVKTFSLAIVVFFLAAYFGFSTAGASFEIPQATTRAVVSSVTLCFAVQILISVLYYLVRFRDVSWSFLV